MIDVNCHSERENRVEESGNNGYSNFDRSGEIFLTKSIKALLTYFSISIKDNPNDCIPSS